MAAVSLNLPGIREENWINKPTYELFEGKPLLEVDKFPRMRYRVACNGNEANLYKSILLNLIKSQFLSV